MAETTHIQSDRSRIKVLAFLSIFIASSALILVPFYWLKGLELLCIISSLVSLVFLGTFWLNKRGYFVVARMLMIIASNLGIIFFSLYIGFNSGIYLYVTVAPLLIYLLYDFKNKSRITGAFGVFLFSFFLIFFLRNERIFTDQNLSPGLIDTFYLINLCSTLLMIFILVTFFALNNANFIEQLETQQGVLTEEITRRTESEEKLQKIVQESELLLAEIHHRVKNNLAIILALMNLESDRLKDPTGKKIFSETRDRIYSISLVHNLLYQNTSVQTIDMNRFFDELCSNIKQTFGNNRVSITKEIQQVELSLEDAVPIALLLNELITNAYKHAFPVGSSGVIRVGLSRLGKDGYRFYVADNGIGMDEKLINSSGTGMSIIHSLIEQLEARLEFNNEKGSCFTIIKGA